MDFQINTTTILLMVIIYMLYQDSEFVQNAVNSAISMKDTFVGCTYCDSYQIGNNFVTLNPFVWPYSGTQCPDDIRILEKDRAVNANAHIPLVSQFVPDHAGPTN